MESESDNVMLFERSARRDLRWWMLALVGTVFLWASQSVPPEENCSEDGECAPWLVPVAGVLGGLALAGGAGPLLANVRRGSRIDMAAGTLEWWQGRTSRHAGDHGAIALADIARIRIERRDEGQDGVSLYDRQGERQPFFDGEVIPWPYDDWARKFVALAPTVVLEFIE